MLFTVRFGRFRTVTEGEHRGPSGRTVQRQLGLRAGRLDLPADVVTLLPQAWPIATAQVIAQAALPRPVAVSRIGARRARPAHGWARKPAGRLRRARRRALCSPSLGPDGSRTSSPRLVYPRLLLSASSVRFSSLEQGDAPPATQGTEGE